MGGDSRGRGFLRNFVCLNPPRPHGRGQMALVQITQSGGLKSTPPAWAGTVFAQAINEALKCLNPPRPHGRGRKDVADSLGYESLNPPRPHGRGHYARAVNDDRVLA